jgi:hypothetical protein
LAEVAKVQWWQKLVSMSLVPPTRLSIHPRANFPNLFSCRTCCSHRTRARTYISVHIHRGREQNKTRNSPLQPLRAHTKLRHSKTNFVRSELDIPAEPNKHTAAVFAGQKWATRRGQQTRKWSSAEHTCSQHNWRCECENDKSESAEMPARRSQPPPCAQPGPINPSASWRHLIQNAGGAAAAAV